MKALDRNIKPADSATARAIVRLATLSLLIICAASAVAAPAADPGATVRRYYTDIEQGKLRDAYRLWANDGQASHQSFTAFSSGFADTQHSSVTIGKVGAIEGAAGSFYVEVPVKITAVQRDGAIRRYAGSYTLRQGDTQIAGNEGAGAWLIWSATIRKLG